MTIKAALLLFRDNQGVKELLFARATVAAKKDTMTPMTLDHVLPFLKAEDIF